MKEEKGFVSTTLQIPTDWKATYLTVGDTTIGEFQHIGDSVSMGIIELSEKMTYENLRKFLNQVFEKIPSSKTISSGELITQKLNFFYYLMSEKSDDGLGTIDLCLIPKNKSRQIIINISKKRSTPSLDQFCEFYPIINSIE